MTIRDETIANQGVLIPAGNLVPSTSNRAELADVWTQPGIRYRGST